MAGAEPPRSLENRCGTKPILRTEPLPPTYLAAPANGQRIIYLNKAGGHFTNAGSTDSSANTFTGRNILADSSIRELDIAPIPAVFNWAKIRDCLEADFKPFNVRLTEERPASGPYIEAVIGGNGTELGYSLSQGLLGITSTDDFCNVYDQGITFNFAVSHEGIPQQDLELCATIAHEAGHALSLEHEILDKDLMSYVPVADSPSKAFVNQVSQCGTDAQHTNGCSCPMIGSGTNSGSRLASNVGARPTDGTAPTLTVKQPADGATVAPEFKVIAQASDTSGMADVIVLVDGLEAGADEFGNGGLYTAVTTANEGTHTITVRARDLAGNVTDKMLTVTAQKLELGDDCTGNASCKSNMCAMESDGTQFCTQTCTPGAAAGAADACPGGFDCDPTAKVCAPSAGGGCCSASTPGSGVAAMLFGVGVGGVLMRRRKRARA